MGQQPHWKLTVRDGSKPAFAVMLACGDKVVVGRSRTCEIILSDLSVSRKHCFFGVGGDGVLKLVDFGALHPTLLNGVVVKEGCAVPVQDGYQVRLGRGSFITVECLGEKRSSWVDPVDPVAYDDLQHTHAEVSEKSDPAEAAEVDLGDDEQNSNHDKLDEKSPVHAPPHASAKSVRLSDQQGKTSLVDLGGVTKQLRSDKLIPPKIGEGNPVPKDGTLVGDDDGDLNIDEATKLIHVNALKQSCAKKVNRSAPQAEVNQNHTEVLGKTLRGTLSQSKKSKSDPVLNNTVRNGSDDGVLNGDEAIITSQPGGGALDETNYVDPAELQRLMKGKKGGKKSAASKGPSRKGAEAGSTAPSDGDSQDETSYIDPAELQRLMQGKAGAFGKKGGKKGAEVKNSALPDGDSQDETSYIDPAELQRLMKGKKGGKKSAASTGPSRKGAEAGSTAPSDGDSQDETSYIDPAELQKLLKGKAGSLGKKGRKMGAAPKQPSRKGDDAGDTGPSDGDSPDETNYIDPAELQKLMKGKAGIFGKKRGKKGAAPRGSSRKGDESENVAPSDGDSPDETSYIDPVELQKLMKGKTKSPRSNKGRSR